MERLGDFDSELSLRSLAKDAARKTLEVGVGVAKTAAMRLVVEPAAVALMTPATILVLTREAVLAAQGKKKSESTSISTLN